MEFKNGTGTVKTVGWLLVPSMEPLLLDQLNTHKAKHKSNQRTKEKL